MENFWKIKELSIITVPYAYIDHSSYLADKLFAERKIRMKYKKEYKRDGSQYRIIMCRVLKKDTGKFEEALEKLKNKMLLLGHTDYEDVCQEVGCLIWAANKPKSE